MSQQTDQENDTVTITVDGRAIEAQPGEMVIAAAERGGVSIPRFCWHPRMKPVGMCRMCLVDIKGPRGFMLQPACFVPVADGQEVVTTSEGVKKAQDGVLEFLLINHPLDCPVCDRGGECPLQDQTSSNRLVRYLGIDSDPVNQGWLCDKGRFSYESTDHPERLGGPLMRTGADGQLTACGWGDALERVTRELRNIIDLHGAGSVA